MNFNNFGIDLKEVTHREGLGISNLDGRLWEEVGMDTARFFSDEALVRARIAVEARYLIYLSKYKVIRKLTKVEINSLLELHTKLNGKEYLALRVVEQQVRHDVITMTQTLKRLLLKSAKSLSDIIDFGWVHFGLGSEDIDNIARSVLIRNFLKEVYLPELIKILNEIGNLSQKTKDVVIPAKTHLQTAVPTILGKEVALYGMRLSESFNKLKDFKLRAKLNGDVGNFSAHEIALPKVNWQKFSKEFVESFDLEWNQFTTQIEPRTKLVELFQTMQNINSILIDMSQDFRIYIGFNWFVQEVKEIEAGSSAMPHKVNPIDFENSHGNSLIANWIFEGMVRQFLISWLQRDLVDKTILRNLGLPFGYSYISLVSAKKGLSRITADTKKIDDELKSDWGILAEAFQAILRVNGQGNAYDELKSLSRGKKLTNDDIRNWVTKLNLDPRIKQQLSKVSFEKYIGSAKENQKEMIIKIKKSISERER